MASHTYMLCPSCPNCGICLYLGVIFCHLLWPLLQCSHTQFFVLVVCLQVEQCKTHLTLCIAAQNELEYLKGRGSLDPCLPGKGTLIEPQGTYLMPHQHRAELCSSQQHAAKVSATLQRPASSGILPACSEAIWQRCWASASDAKLRVGAVWGASQVSLLVFLFGFGGFLAIWGGLWEPSGPSDPGNTILFGLLNPEGQQVRCLGAVPSRVHFKAQHRI